MAIVGANQLIIGLNHGLIRAVDHITAAAIEIVLLMLGICHFISHATNTLFHLALDFFQFRNKSREATMLIDIDLNFLV